MRNFEVYHIDRLSVPYLPPLRAPRWTDLESSNSESGAEECSSSDMASAPPVCISAVANSSPPESFIHPSSRRCIAQFALHPQERPTRHNTLTIKHFVAIDRHQNVCPHNDSMHRGQAHHRFRITALPHPRRRGRIFTPRYPIDEASLEYRPENCE